MLLYGYWGGWEILRKTTRVIFIISLAVNLLGILIAGFIFYKVGGVSYVSAKLDDTHVYDENPYYVERTELFNGVGVKENSTIFIGDSITQRGLWDELLPNSNIINRGINSDTTEGVKNRLNEIVDSNPERVFLMIGVNDLYAGLPLNETISNYEEILKQIKTGTPDTEVYVQSVLPLNYEMYSAGDKIKNETIQELNKSLKYLSEEHGYTYVNLYSLFETEGQLNKQYSYDGIHLNGEGYNVWGETIKRYVD